MRLPVELFRRLSLTLLALGALSGCMAFGGDFDELATAPRAVGPAADYPVVVGEPYRVGNSTFTPNDTLNYDEVGYAIGDGGAGISGAHHTLPLPSYVEVTSLDTGRTILLRIERRGPMDSDALVALSPGAAAQLGMTAVTPVRVRRVNPVEEDRAILRMGQSAPLRMDTPESLLTVLKRKVPANQPLQFAYSPPPSQIPGYSMAPSSAARGLPPMSQTQPQQYPPQQYPPQQYAQALPQSLLPPSGNEQGYAPAPVYYPPQQYQQPAPAQQYQQPAPAPVQPRYAAPQRPTSQSPAPVAGDGGYVVQVAALSSLENARRVAGAVGGQVTQVRGLYRVRTGPFDTVRQAEASLAKVQAAGYSEARIFTNG